LLDSLTSIARDIHPMGNLLMIIAVTIAVTLIIVAAEIIIWE